MVLERARRLLRQQAPVAVVLSELRKLSCPSDGDGEPGGGGDGRCWTDWEAQGWMTRALVEDPLDDAFPLAADYRARFLRRLSQALEEEGAEEIAEPMLRELNAYLLGGDAHQQQSDSYVTFFCPTTAAAGAGLGLGEVVGAPVRVPLACRVAPRENQVGLKLWEACFVLADFLMCTPGMVAGRHVVELGAGVGLLGLIARSCLGAARVTLTDVDPEVLQFLRHNVQVNDHHGGVGVGGGGPLEVAALDWSEPAEYQGLLGAGAARGEHGGEGPVILAADCIYDRDAIPSFVEVLAWALRQDARTVALVASTLRNPETYALFEAEVERQGLAMEEELLPPKCVGSEDEDEVFASWWVPAGGAGERWRYESPFYCPNRGAVRLCRIRLRDTPGGDAGDGN